MCNTHGTEHLDGSGGARVPDWFLRATMRREFLEEWYDDRDLEEGRIVDWHSYVDTEWARRVGGAEIRLTGLVYDLLNLRPEVCGVVVVGQREGKLNKEYVRQRTHTEYPLDRPGGLGPEEMVQGGAAALLLAQATLAAGRVP